MTGKKTAEMDRWLEEKIRRCGRCSQTLRADDRADEAAFEKIRANVYDIFRTVLSVAEKTCGDEEDAVRDFFARRAQTISAQRKKERIILEEIVKAFAFDRIYSEREVNIIIADYHDDFCSIRRDMIAEKLLARDTTGYWRVKPE